MKKNKGFTLVELLVVISIIAAIILVAVISLSTIAENQKEDSYKLLVNEIEIGAKQYFKANEYFIDEMKDEIDGSGKEDASKLAYVSVATLKEYGYLTKTIDPRNNKEIDGCSIVTYDGNSDYKYHDIKETKKMFNVSDESNVDHCIQNEPDIVSKKITSDKKYDESTPDVYDLKATITLYEKIKGNPDTKGKKIGNSYTVYEPNSSINVSNWINGLDNKNGVWIDYSFDGIDELEIHHNDANQTESVANNNIDQIVDTNVSLPSGTTEFTDEGVRKMRFIGKRSGNEVMNVILTVRIDKTAPVITVNNFDENKWKNKNFKINFGGSDSLSGIKNWYYNDKDNYNTSKYDSSASGNGTGNYITSDFIQERNGYYYYYLADKAGNYATRKVKILLDKTAPVITVKDFSENTPKTSNFKIHLTSTENLSGMHNWYYNYKVGDSLIYDYNASGNGSTNYWTSNFTQNQDRYIYYYAYDKAGNYSYKRIRIYKVTYATGGCSASKVYMSDSACNSGYNNDISARLKVKCNGKIDYVTVKYYYPGASSKVCSGNSSSKAVCKQYPGGSASCSNTSVPSYMINGAVFNFRGCGVNRVTYKYKVVANGRVIHDFDDEGWNSYDFTSSSGATKLCSPAAGSDWFD